MDRTTSSATPRVAVVSGGVGAARFLRALQDVVPAADVAAIVNTGDDTVLHGLSISPDLDTIAYTLAGAIDPERGWGLGGETWQAMEALGRYATVRPEGSAAATTWFNLGDRDLATHLYRTARLAEGATPTEVADEVRRAWGIDVRLLPMTDGHQATMIELASGEEVAFQDYFVRLHHDVPVRGVRFAGDADADGRRPRRAQRRRHDRRRPVEPDRVDRPDPQPARHRRPPRAPAATDVVAVSPIVGGAALKGPADRMLAELGHEPSVVGVARLYAPIAAALVIDPVDAALAAGRRAGGHAGRRAAVDHGDAGRRRRPRRGHARRGRLTHRSAQRRASRPSASVVHGDQARWMRARTGDTAKRSTSSPRAATLTGSGPSGATSFHRSRSDVCTPVPTLTTSPLPRCTGAHEGVDDVVDVDEVAALATVAGQARRASAPSTRRRARRRHRRRVAAAARRRTTTASAVNSIPQSSRYAVRRSTIALATTPRTPRGASEPSLTGRSRPDGWPYSAVAGSATTTFVTPDRRAASSTPSIDVNERPRATADSSWRVTSARW